MVNQASQAHKQLLSRGYMVDFCCDFTRDRFRGRSVINVLVLCILIATFLGDILLHIFQKEKIVTKNRPCSRGFRKTEKVLSASHKDTAVDIVRFYCTSVFEINFSGPLFTRQ